MSSKEIATLEGGKFGKICISLRELLNIAVEYVSSVKFIYSEKTTKFCEFFPLLLTTVHTVKSKRKISQNFMAFSEYMNFNTYSVMYSNVARSAIFVLYRCKASFLLVLSQPFYD